MVLFIVAVRLLAENPEPDASTVNPGVVAGETGIEGVLTEPQVAHPATAPTDRLPPPSAEPAAASSAVRFTARPVEPTYTVAQGDNLYTIAQRHGTTAEAIRGMNNMSDSFLRVGQRLVLP
jgi:LysM repeat protein